MAAHPLIRWTSGAFLRAALSRSVRFDGFIQPAHGREEFLYRFRSVFVIRKLLIRAINIFPGGHVIVGESLAREPAAVDVFDAIAKKFHELLRQVGAPFGRNL